TKKATVRLLGKELGACHGERNQGAPESPAQGSSSPNDLAHAWEGNGDEIGSATHYSPVRTSDIRALGGGPNVTPEVRALIETQTIHYMSVFVVDPEGGGPAYVGLEVNADGSLRKLRRRLAAIAPAFLRRLFDGCDGFNPSCDERALQDFMARNTQRPNVFFVALPGRSVSQIQDEQSLRLNARQRFEQAQVNWRTPTRKPPEPASPRQAPSSASAIWDHIREQLIGAPLVEHGSTRPFGVRWSLNMGGWRDHVNLWGTRLFAALLVASACRWFATSAPARGLAAAAFAFGFAAIVVFVAWWRESPRALRGAGRWLVVRGALYSWLASGAVLALSLGAAALLWRVALPISRFPSNNQAVATLAVIAFLGALTFSRIGVRASVSGALLLLLVEIAVKLPAASFPYVVSVIVALIGILPLLVAIAFSYVMVGLSVALVAAAMLAAGWLSLAVLYAGAPLHLAAFGCGVTLGLLAGAFVRLALWLSAVRRAEEKENASTRADRMPSLEHLKEVVEPEDRTLQNHIVVVSRLKDNALRVRTLRRVLRGVSLLVKVYFNRGELGGIRTIHFAQFIVFGKKKEPKRLLFLSNYDSAFGSYLQEFNRVLGVTAVWSNCEGFPPTFGLVGDGARDEQHFKQFGRHDQIPTLGWYSAYPGLFISDIETATSTREDLRRQIDDPSTWIGRMRARFGRPLSEADCDAALRRL
ncbi:MAG TPA: hypothetical protein VGY54_07695, partial [Polyangiaceae bacterium]|nr:hypothetical protein [Polyangiaceae bacterium]